MKAINLTPSVIKKRKRYSFLSSMPIGATRMLATQAIITMRMLERIAPSHLLYPANKKLPIKLDPVFVNEEYAEISG